MMVVGCGEVGGREEPGGGTEPAEFVATITAGFTPLRGHARYMGYVLFTAAQGVGISRWLGVARPDQERAPPRRKLPAPRRVFDDALNRAVRNAFEALRPAEGPDRRHLVLAFRTEPPADLVRAVTRPIPPPRDLHEMTIAEIEALAFGEEWEQEGQWYWARELYSTGRLRFQRGDPLDDEARALLDAGTRHLRDLPYDADADDLGRACKRMLDLEDGVFPALAVALEGPPPPRPAPLQTPEEILALWATPEPEA